jgi:prefoldin beta subunit
MEAHEKHTIEQNLHSIAVQKQTLQQQLMETDLALKELEGATNAYRMVAGLMLQTSADKLREDLAKKKEVAATRMHMLERQEEKLKAKLQEHH